MLILTCYISNAQIYELGIKFGGANFVGDLGDNKILDLETVSFGGILKYNLNDRIALRADINYYNISYNDLDSDDQSRVKRGLVSDYNLIQFAGGIEVNFYSYNLSEYNITQNYTPYFLFQFSTFTYSTFRLDDSTKLEPYEKIGFSVPIGIGFKGRLKNNWAFAIEFTANYTFHDDLDIDKDVFAKTTYAEGIDQANKNDWFMNTGATLIYTFGRAPCYIKTN